MSRDRDGHVFGHACNYLKESARLALCLMGGCCEEHRPKAPVTDLKAARLRRQLEGLGP
ncbi:MAG TPA: hypothetical protein VGX68_20050 [Thermoanaerobaculia bacterium]|nr:hypothetical protein [Thermoanaerobaculia bacterium]